MKTKEALAIFIGAFQGLLGALCIVLAYLLHYDPAFMPVRSLLNIQLEHVAFYMMVLLVTGLFSIMSGVLIVHERS